MAANDTPNNAQIELISHITATVSRQRKYAIAAMVGILAAGLVLVALVLHQVQEKLSLLSKTEEKIASLVVQKMEREAEIRKVELKLQSAAEELRTLEKKIAESNSKLQSPETGRALKEALSRTEAIRSGIESASGSLSGIPSTRSTSAYSISLFVMSPSDDERASLNSRIQSLGYRLAPTSFTVSPGSSHSWFAKQPTVFYYSPSNAAAAREIARQLKSMTGRDFSVQIGNGLNVSTEERLSVMVVHMPA